MTIVINNVNIDRRTRKNNKALRWSREELINKAWTIFKPSELKLLSWRNKQAQQQLSWSAHHDSPSYSLSPSTVINL